MKIERIAVVMFGMLRCFEHTSPFFKKHLENSKDILQKFPNCEFDYFFFGYPNKSGIEHCERLLLDLYKPKSYQLIEWNDDIKKTIEKEVGGLQDLVSKQIGNTSPINCLSNHRCRKLSNDLRKRWASENHVKHDLIIYARIDSFFFRDMMISEIEMCNQKDVVVIPDDWDFKSVNEDAVSDTFAMGNEDSMNRYFDSYDHFPALVREKSYHFHPETLMGAHIKHSGLIRKVCKRHVAFEYPFSEGDVLELWKDDWSKEEVEKMLGIDLTNLKPRHRDNL